MNGLESKSSKLMAGADDMIPAADVMFSAPLSADVMPSSINKTNSPCTHLRMACPFHVRGLAPLETSRTVSRPFMGN